MKRLWIIPALLLVLTACDSSSDTGPTADFFVGEGQRFILRAADTAGVNGGQLVISFDNIRGDSRCPASVTCVQAGAATVELTIQSLDRQDTVQIDVPPDGDAETNFDDFVVSIIEVSPEAMENVTLSLIDYSLIMAVAAVVP